MSKKKSEKIIVQVIDPFTEFNDVKGIWISLIEKCPHPYHLSWGWIEVWINSLNIDCGLKLVVYFKDQSPIVAFFIGSKIETYNRYFNFHKLSLNQTLIPEIDIVTYIEYNTILVDPDTTISLELFLDLIPVKSWDELELRRYFMYQDKFNFNITGNKYIVTMVKQYSYYVELDKVRNNKNNYFSLVSNNRRKQILRAIREYEKIGEIQVCIAENEGEALKIFHELTALHQERWTNRGYKGTYSTEYSIKFHESLITQRFKYGEIQLMRISAGQQTIGCSYNYIYKNKVYTISGGFNYLPENYFQPGFVCDYYGIMHNTELGLQFYDFMENEAEYKKSLSTNYNSIYSIHIIRNSAKYRIWKFTVWLYQMLVRTKPETR